MLLLSVPLERGYYGALVGVFHELLSGVALEGGKQRLCGVVVLMAFLYYQNVGVGIGGDGVLILYGKGVLHLEACLNGVVAIDDGRVHVLKGAGQLGCLNLLDVQILGVLGYPAR